jgi:small subunit ribosomal protein S7
VPWPIGEKEAEFRAIKFLKKVIQDQTDLAEPGTHNFRLTMARELIAGSKNEGMTVKAKQEHHRLCEANRAFAHYRR